MNLIKKLEIGIEEIILVFLILIELLDFFTAIPPELEFIEKSVALITMTYLFYKASITKVLFGKKERLFDGMIVVSWFLISLNTVIGFAISVGEEKILASGFYSALIQNFYLIEKTGFLAGTLTLLIISILLVREKVQKSCLLQIIHEQKKAVDWKHKILRFFVIYIVLLAFYLLVYGFAIEWLAITVDAPIIVIVLLAYLILVVKKRKEVKTASFLEKVSEKSEEFYENYIKLFHSKRTVVVAMTGLLVLHLLVEIGHFIIPYVTGLLYTWYFKQLGPGHEPLWMRMGSDLAMSSGVLQQMGVVLVYMLNLLAILALFLAPAFLWWHMYKRRAIKPPNIIWLFFGGVAAFIILPVFRITQVKSKVLMGADIITQNLPFLENVWWVVLVSAMVMVIFYMLGKKDVHKTAKVALAVSLLYFAYYLYHFFVDVAKRYISAIIATGQTHQYFTALHLLIFLALTIAFYLTGFMAFGYNALRKQKV